MSAAIFAGGILAKDPRWQNVTQTYTSNLFQACRALRAWPAPLRPIVVWYLKECKVCRDQIAEARKILAEHQFGTAERDTAFTWMDPRADPVIVQLALAAGALHTTSQLLNQALLDLAYAASDGQAVVDQLQKEFGTCLEASGGKILPSTLPKMNIMEACIKETQRLKPQTLTNLDRLALKAVVLPNGVRVPQGTMISVNQATMWDAETWGEDALVWDPMRWFEPGTTELGRERLVNSSDRHFAFGKGRFICPGRFLVNGELKVALGVILDGWEVRLCKEDYEEAKKKGRGRVDWVPFGFEMLADGRAGVEVRKR